MMWFKLAGMAAVLTAGAYTADQVAQELGPQAQRTGAQQTFSDISDASYYDYLLTGDDWSLVISRTVDGARHNDYVTVEGTTLYWRFEDTCFFAEVPTPDDEAEAQPCK